MATTKKNKVGYIRKRLAKILEEALPGLHVDPAELYSQIPIYASPLWDCCSWYGWGYKNGLLISLACWQPMGECIKNGIQFSDDSTECDIEVIIKPHTFHRLP